MGWRDFGFFHHSRTIFCRAVPNLSLTIRNFFIAVPQALLEMPDPAARLHGVHGLWELAAGTPAGGGVLEAPLYAALVHVAPVTAARASLPEGWRGRVFDLPLPQAARWLQEVTAARMKKLRIVTFTLRFGTGGDGEWSLNDGNPQATTPYV
jgi:hypothetical protein